MKIHDREVDICIRKKLLTVINIKASGTWGIGIMRSGRGPTKSGRKARRGEARCYVTRSDGLRWKGSDQIQDHIVKNICQLPRSNGSRPYRSTVILSEFDVSIAYTTRRQTSSTSLTEKWSDASVWHKLETRFKSQTMMLNLYKVTSKYILCCSLVWRNSIWYIMPCSWIDSIYK